MKPQRFTADAHIDARGMAAHFTALALRLAMPGRRARLQRHHLLARCAMTATARDA